MRILSKSPTIFTALLLSILPALGADEPAAMPSLRTVVEAENNFAHTCLERGIRESFLQFFADDSIIFAPEPTNGKKFYTDYEDKGRKLIWLPIFATIANSGDLGVTTGPWEMQKSATDKTPLAFGDFLSIWKKQRDNSWKVIVDVGIDHPEPSKAPGDVQLLPPDEVPAKIDVDLARRRLEKAEEMLAEMLKEGAGSALTASASNDVRVLRDNSFPAIGRIAAKLMLSSDNGKMTRTKSGGGMSASGDLAYRYGSYVSERANVTERGHFLTIWKAEGDQDWKILVDLQKKEPEKKP
jgi:ketosteroid isomerase-like protein